MMKKRNLAMSITASFLVIISLVVFFVVKNSSNASRNREIKTGESLSTIAEVEDYAKKLQDAQIQIDLLNDTIIEIKKPYQNWPKWLVGVINFVLNLFRKNKKEVGK